MPIGDEREALRVSNQVTSEEYRLNNLNQYFDTASCRASEPDSNQKMSGPSRLQPIMMPNLGNNVPVRKDDQFKRVMSNDPIKVGDQRNVINATKLNPNQLPNITRPISVNHL